MLLRLTGKERFYLLGCYFSPKMQLPFQTAQRLQRYAIKLMAYQFHIKYKATKQHGNADGLLQLTTQINLAFDEVERG